MVFMVVNGEDINQVLSVLPAEIVSKIDFLIVLLQALGGLFVLYLIFFVVRFYFLRKQTKMLEEMKKDIALIKKKLKKYKK